MLKSNRTGDSRSNTNLRNLKLLSSSRHGSITDSRMEFIDDVLREIDAEHVESTEDKNIEVPFSKEIDVSDQIVVNDANDDCNTTTETIQNELPVLMAIQYNNISDIIGAVEGFLNSNRQIYEDQGTNMIVCPQCESTEMKHSEQIAEISKWRKSFMSSLNLKTVTHV